MINLPAYAPDHNPQEHVWKYGKDKIANTQCALDRMYRIL
ncbi:hypothetical protein HYW46_03270 [Candidatus Daviesbacteria bacterium]|nr:hypothetical protein [Candidatus Daviesbacteria bacterium]